MRNLLVILYGMYAVMTMHTANAEVADVSANHGIWHKEQRNGHYLIGSKLDGISAEMYIHTPNFPYEYYIIIIRPLYSQPGEPGYNPDIRGPKSALPNVSPLKINLSLNNKPWAHATLNKLSPSLTLALPDKVSISELDVDILFDNGLKIAKKVMFQEPVVFGPGPTSKIEHGAYIDSQRPGWATLACISDSEEKYLRAHKWYIWKKSTPADKVVLQDIQYLIDVNKSYSKPVYGLRYYGPDPVDEIIFRLDCHFGEGEIITATDKFNYPAFIKSTSQKENIY